MDIRVSRERSKEIAESELIVDTGTVQIRVKEIVVVVVEQRTEVELEMILMSLLMSALMRLLMFLVVSLVMGFMLRLMELRGGRVELSEEVVHVEMETIESILAGRRGERLMTLRVVLATFRRIAEHVVRFSDRSKCFFSFGIFVFIRMIFQCFEERDEDRLE